MWIQVLIEVINTFPLAGCVCFYEVYVVKDVRRDASFCNWILEWYMYRFAPASEIFDIEACSRFTCWRSLRTYEGIIIQFTWFFNMVGFRESYYVRLMSFHFHLQLVMMAVKAADVEVPKRHAVLHSCFRIRGVTSSCSHRTTPLQMGRVLPYLNKALWVCRKVLMKTGLWRCVSVFGYYIYCWCLSSTYPFLRCIIFLLSLSLPICNFVSTLGSSCLGFLDPTTLLCFVAFLPACFAFVVPYVSENDFLLIYALHSCEV